MSTNTDNPKMVFAGVDAGAKMFVELNGAFAEAANAADADQRRNASAESRPGVRQSPAAAPARPHSATNSGRWLMGQIPLCSWVLSYRLAFQPRLGTQVRHLLIEVEI